MDKKEDGSHWATVIITWTIVAAIVYSVGIALVALTQWVL